MKTTNDTMCTVCLSFAGRSVQDLSVSEDLVYMTEMSLETVC